MIELNPAERLRIWMEEKNFKNDSFKDLASIQSFWVTKSLIGLYCVIFC